MRVHNLSSSFEKQKIKDKQILVLIKRNAPFKMNTVMNGNLLKVHF